MMNSFVEAQNSLKRKSYPEARHSVEAWQSHAVRFSFKPEVMKSPGLKPVEAQNARLARLWPLSNVTFFREWPLCQKRTFPRSNSPKNC
jgi:hypothetical protein